MNQEELKHRLQPLVANYQHAQAAVVPALHALLETREPIDNDALAVVAELCGVDVRSIAELVAYYPIFQNGHSSHTDVCLRIGNGSLWSNLVKERTTTCLSVAKRTANC